MNKHILLFVLLLWASASCAQWHIDENFDAITTLPAGWSIHDDGDGMVWRNLNNATHAYSGTRAAFCDNYLPNQNADWLITPQFQAATGDSLIFYTRSWISTENLKVYVSTTGTAVSNFTTQLLYLQNIGTTYQRVSLTLSNYAGQNIYLGFLWNCTNYGILIDDVRIGHPLVVQPVLELPDSFSLFQGEAQIVDFTPYITCTDFATAALSVSGNEHIIVTIAGMGVTLFSLTWTGDEVLTFTLHDGSTGLSDTDTVEIHVLPVPAFDLALASFASPRPVEFQNHVFMPSVTVLNAGTAIFSNLIELSATVKDSTGAELYQATVFEQVSLQPEASTELVFGDGCTLGTAGMYEIVFRLLTNDGNPLNDSLNGSFGVVYRITQSEPDAFGYRFVDSNDAMGPGYNWIDISTSGTSAITYGVPSWSGDDNFSEPVPLGFSFPFYGTSYTQMYVDINGEILLADNPWYEAYPTNGWDSDGNMFNYTNPIPGYTQMPALIAVYWDDLYADQGTGNIWFQTFGTTPNRYTIVQWNNLRFLAGSGGSPVLKFQVIFHENGEILMQYQTTQTGQSGSSVPHQNGRSATVGIQNESANIGLCFLREIVQNNQYQGVTPPGNLLYDNLAIRFYTAADTQAPVLTHTQPGNTFDASPTIRLNALDLSPIATLQLHYLSPSGWTSLNYTSAYGNDYVFQLPALALGTDLVYYFSAVDALGNACTLPANAPASTYQFRILPTAGVNVLLAYSGRQDYQLTELPVYTNLFNSANLSYDIYNWEEYDSYRFPDQYQAIFCYASVGPAGSRGDTLSYALMDYLDNGTSANPKNLFFSSDGWAFSQGGYPNTSPVKKLFNAYFRSFYVPTGSGGGTNGLSGPDFLGYDNGSILCLDTSPIGTAALEYAVYANSPDCIFRYTECPDWYADTVQYPAIGALNAFAFEGGPVNGHAFLYHGVCATSVELPIYKAFYFSFDLSQLTNSAQRLELVEDLVDWFGISPVPIVDEQAPGYGTSITGNCPNPFNPETTISLTLKHTSNANLDIYNARGQHVRNLGHRVLSAGKHNFVWDGRDNAGIPVASGVYIVRLGTPGAVSSRKIMLVK